MRIIKSFYRNYIYYGIYPCYLISGAIKENFIINSKYIFKYTKVKNNSHDFGDKFYLISG